ncbi:glycosyltransferase family 4 protein [Cryptosporangium aurantiacum]|uniref:Glycosyltransferase involved in cell wall bisynthesis n=1 Tax=Cryptosporangium aurantiacum TaxID=134849 RepID=A0A1M7RLQ7_9ACTN|nr:glycosyltransferase family 4 protein [Cryptosporangium aurantiacum]SHN47042.1 Glycosyltransferase involved in cell wall bisynthesis [Cryptosporangium aurantiacum]
MKVALLTLGDPATMTGGYLYHRRVADRAAANDARLDFVSVPTWPWPLPVAAGPRLLRRLAQLHPDAVLLDSIAAAYVGPWLPKKGLPPIIGMLHQPPGGIDHEGLRRYTQQILDRRAYRFASKLLIASDDLADTLRAAGLPADLLTVVAPGRDPADNPVAPEGDLRQGRKAAVLSVGNWVERKGLLDLLEAVAALPPDAVTLHLVGDPDVDPDYGARVRVRMKEPDLHGRVVAHGLKTPAEVVGFYRAADVFALASVREPYGTVYGEAMSAGLPVVGWDAGNLPHLARHGVEGLAVPPGDVRELTTALRSLAYDEPRRRQMAAAAKIRSESFPNWDDTARVLFTEIRAVVEETRT